MKVVKKIWGTLSTIIVVLAVIFAVLLVGVRVVGLRALTVLSGSMEPTYHTGSLIYVRQADPHTELEAGDVITYTINDNTVVTHRIVRVAERLPSDMPDEEGHIPLRFITKGDANESEDGTPVLCKNIVGTPVFSLPYLGYAASYLQSEQGRIAAIFGGALLILLVFLPDLLFDDKSKRRAERKKGKVQAVSVVPCAALPHDTASVTSATEQAVLPEASETPAELEASEPADNITEG